VGADLDIEGEGKRLFLDRHYEAVRVAQFQIFKSNLYVEFHPSFKALTERWEMGYGPVNAGLGL